MLQKTKKLLIALCVSLMFAMGLSLTNAHASSAQASCSTDMTLSFISDSSQIPPLTNGLKVEVSSYTFPPLARLDLTLAALGGRAHSKETRDAYFDRLCRDRKSGISQQNVMVDFYLPSAFQETEKYPFLVYLPGSGGMCLSEETLVKRIAELGAVVVVAHSNLSRAGGNKVGASSAEDQLSNKNHLNLAMDAIRIAEVLEGHPNVRAFGAVGSSLGAVALSAIADRSISGPLHKDSTFTPTSDITDGREQWDNASPFRALMHISPLFAVQQPGATTPTQTRVSVFSGVHDTWCEVYPTLKALASMQGHTKLHLLNMGHSPESLWEEWERRIGKYPAKYESIEMDAQRFILCKEGQNISNCSSILPPFSLFGLIEKFGDLTSVQQEKLMKSLTIQMIGAAPCPEEKLPYEMKVLQSLMKRASKGTLLEPNEKAIACILGEIKKELRFVVDEWDEDLWQSAARDTFASQLLARGALGALEPYAEALREEALNPVKKREIYKEALSGFVTISTASVSARNEKDPLDA